MSARTIVVVGATGEQGSGAIRALLASTSFTVRAVTSNPAGEKARALLGRFPEEAQDGRLELVQADLNDMASLKKALESAYGLFAAWASAGNELQEGKNLVDAAKVVGIAHFVYSSYPSIAKATNGRFSGISVLNVKADIEAYAREHLPAVTAVVPENGVAVFTPPIEADTITEWVDGGHDVGVFAAAIFHRGASVASGKTYYIAGPSLTFDKLVEQYAAVTGEKAVYRPRSPEEVVASLSLPDEVKTILIELSTWINTSKNPQRRFFGMVTNEEVQQGEVQLGVKPSTFEEWLRRSGWRVQ
ncbi:hypothetical protein JCM10207_007544 [Rhodosporidiobolus poonsookiae]